MGGLFSKPKVPDPPKVPQPPPPPTVDEAMAAQVEGDRLNRRRGRASNILASSGSSGRTATKMLLGT